MTLFTIGILFLVWLVFIVLLLAVLGRSKDYDNRAHDARNLTTAKSGESKADWNR